ncbi:hypothetical protein [Pantoea sp. C2G6]|uniref:hypothetical protein n=1 Tax=Pantoea sp. C2G6 TaxID=3243084 RepID=UPI003ED8CB95
MSKEEMIKRLSYYGFSEVADILRFIKLVCSSPPDLIDFTYIRNKVGSCLDHNDDGSEYFIGLREFASELDAVLYYIGR